MGKWWGHFAAAYGTFWAALLSLALLTQSHINTAEFGLYVVPVLCAVYATWRKSQPDESLRLRAEVAALSARLSQYEYVGPPEPLPRAVVAGDREPPSR
jgi:hypothetical protein